MFQRKSAYLPARSLKSAFSAASLRFAAIYLGLCAIAGTLLVLPANVVPEWHAPDARDWPG